jgi:hypothetical protein
MFSTTPREILYLNAEKFQFPCQPTTIINKILSPKTAIDSKLKPSLEDQVYLTRLAKDTSVNMFKLGRNVSGLPVVLNGWIWPIYD